MALTEAQHRRNKVAILSRHHPESAALEEARRDLAAEKLAAYIRRTVDASPPLSTQQRDRLAQLLGGGRVA